MASSWGTSWLSSWLDSWGAVSSGVTGSGTLLSGAASMTGAGTVTGVGTPGHRRKHKIYLDYEPILYRQ